VVLERIVLQLLLELEPQPLVLLEPFLFLLQFRVLQQVVQTFETFRQLFKLQDVIQVQSTGFGVRERNGDSNVLQVESDGTKFRHGSRGRLLVLQKLVRLRSKTVERRQRRRWMRIKALKSFEPGSSRLNFLECSTSGGSGSLQSESQVSASQDTCSTRRARAGAVSKKLRTRPSLLRSGSGDSDGT
jgi:hypothetical protein